MEARISGRNQSPPPGSPYIRNCPMISRRTTLDLFGKFGNGASQNNYRRSLGSEMSRFYSGRYLIRNLHLRILQIFCRRTILENLDILEHWYIQHCPLIESHKISGIAPRFNRGGVINSGIRNWFTSNNFQNFLEILETLMRYENWKRSVRDLFF